MFKMYTKKSTSRKNIFQQLKKNKLPYLVTLFQSQLLRNWAEQSKFWWIFFYEKSFYLSNKKRMRSWASILKKLEGGRLFASCTCRGGCKAEKNLWEKFSIFFSPNFLHTISMLVIMMGVCKHDLLCCVLTLRDFAWVGRCFVVDSTSDSMCSTLNTVLWWVIGYELT